MRFYSDDAIYAMGGHVSLKPFDRDDYECWMGAESDDFKKRPPMIGNIVIEAANDSDPEAKHEGEVIVDINGIGIYFNVESEDGEFEGNLSLVVGNYHKACFLARHLNATMRYEDLLKLGFDDHSYFTKYKSSPWACAASPDYFEKELKIRYNTLKLIELTDDTSADCIDMIKATNKVKIVVDTKTDCKWLKAFRNINHF